MVWVSFVWVSRRHDRGGLHVVRRSCKVTRAAGNPLRHCQDEDTVYTLCTGALTTRRGTYSEITRTSTRA